MKSLSERLMDLTHTSGSTLGGETDASATFLPMHLLDFVVLIEEAAAIVRRWEAAAVCTEAMTTNWEGPDGDIDEGEVLCSFDGEAPQFPRGQRVRLVPEPQS